MSTNELWIAVAAISIASMIVAIYAVLTVRITRKKMDAILGSLTSKTIRAVIKQADTKQKKRVRKRYLVVKIVRPGELRKEQLQKSIVNAITELFGATSVSMTQPQVLYVNQSTKKVVIRFRAPAKWKVISSLGLLEVNGEIITAIPERTTGTFKKAKTYADTP